MIEDILIIGSGVMGLGIAELFANCNVKVDLIDIALADNPNKNFLAETAIKKSKIFRKFLITPGNLNEAEQIIANADWIIEVIKENLVIKKQLFANIARLAKLDCIISSNTSTIKLKELISDLDLSRRQHFVVTHFFNPPRFVNLVELIAGEEVNPNIIAELTDFLDCKLGKIIVQTKDTPGFIANRIGCFWLEFALSYAIKQQITIEEIDFAFGKPIGMPSTGIFGLFDLIGIDTMELISQSLLSSLPEDDLFVKNYYKHQLIQTMLEKKLLGKKTKAGFYRSSINSKSEKILEVIDLKTGLYREIKPIKQNLNLNELFLQKKYFRDILGQTLAYAASLVGVINDEVTNIDQAMKLGYNWRYGPFELIEQLGENFINYLKNVNQPLSQIISNKSIFKRNLNQNNFFKLEQQSKIYTKQNLQIYQTEDQVAIIEFTSKNDVLELDIFAHLNEFLSINSGKFSKYVVKGGIKNFALGANLKWLLEKANNQEFELIRSYLNIGQQTMQCFKKNNVIAAVTGLAYGGGAEILLHSKAVFAHTNAFSGLVETKVGLIPSWGGCKEMIFSARSAENLIRNFTNIVHGKISEDAFEIANTLNLRDVKVVPNNFRVLSEAVKYSNLPGDVQLAKKFEINWDEALSKQELKNYDLVIGKRLVEVFSSEVIDESVLLEKEQEIFLSLIANIKTQERIKYMIQTGEKLEN